MPSTYAHYRFGQLAFSKLPEDIRRSAQRFRQLYEIGLQGPDLFFYYQPLFRTKIGALGRAYHALSGREFFEKAVEQFLQNPSEGAEAYLYGVLAHYALDSACHPLICGSAAEGKFGHTELETEFDRYLLTLDGMEPAYRQTLGSQVGLTWGGCVTVSQFYPPASAYSIRRSVGILSLTGWMLARKNRTFVQRFFSMGGVTAKEMVMYPRANHKCSHLDEQLKSLFDQALEQYPILAEQLSAYIRGKTPLGEEFESHFG